MRLQIACATILALSLSASVESRAATSTSNMTVSIQITAGCNVSVTNINFGSLPATTLTAAQTSTAAMGGLYTYTCSPGVALPTLTAGQGNNYLTGSNRMKGLNGTFIPYTLALPTLAAATGAAQTGQITATIPAQSTLPAVDTYTDTVVLTLTY